MKKTMKKQISIFLKSYWLYCLIFLFCVIEAIIIAVNYQNPGTYCHEVVVQNIKNGKEYILPAEVHYFGKGNYPEYELIKFYWPNGGYCLVESEVEVNKPISVSASGASYNVTLTSTHTTYSKVVELKEDSTLLYDLRYHFILCGLILGAITISYISRYRKAKIVEANSYDLEDSEESINKPDELVALLEQKYGKKDNSGPLSSEEFYRPLDEQNAKLDADRRNEHRDHRKFSVVETIEDR